MVRIVRIWFCSGSVLVGPISQGSPRNSLGGPQRTFAAGKRAARNPLDGHLFCVCATSNASWAAHPARPAWSDKVDRANPNMHKPKVSAPEIIRLCA